jgi:hypothetical protein
MSTPTSTLPKKRQPRLEGVLVEGLVEALDLLVVGRDAGAEQAPRRRQPLEQVDLHVAAGAQQRVGGERPGRAGADDRDRVRAIRRPSGPLGGALLGEELGVQLERVAELLGQLEVGKIASTGHASTQASQSMQTRRVDVELLGGLEVGAPGLDVCSPRDRPPRRSRP